MLHLRSHPILSDAMLGRANKILTSGPAEFPGWPVADTEITIVLERGALFDEPIVREFPLRILIEHFEIRMRRRGVEVVAKLLNVFAVISLTVREAENPLFQNRMLPIPEGQS